MNGPIPFTDGQIANMCSSHKAGASIESLAHEYGISFTAVKSRLLKNRVKIRGKGSPRLKRDQIFLTKAKALRDEGMTIAEVCKALGMSQTAYYRRIHA